jgi:hypothetical protein
MVKITLEFEGVEQAIVALGKLGGIVAAPADKAPRKGRNDKGQTREPYKPRVQDDASTKAIAKGTSGDQAGESRPAAITDASNGGTPPASTSTTAEAPSAPVHETAKVFTTASASPSPSDVVKAEIQAQQKTQGTGFPEPTIGEKDVEVQAAINAIYEKVGIDPVKTLLAGFGVDKARNLPKSKKAEFLAAAQKIVA